MNSLIKIIKKLLSIFNISVMKKSTYDRLISNQKPMLDDLVFIGSLHKVNLKELIPALQNSKSQLKQDIFVLNLLDYKKNGYFVEFGATNGIDLSNSYLLETQFSWSGILCEPAKIWHEKLLKNRSSQIDYRCVWSHSGDKLLFNEVDSAELSTVKSVRTKDLYEFDRMHGKQYFVESISLEELLNYYKSPKIIDYLSIDTEGSEYDILERFDFNLYRFRVITCEHNYTENRDKIFQLLTHHGYKRVHEDISRFDDWYINVELN